MALTRDQQRLVNMDTYIQELNYLYERELQHELDVNKRNLLLSKGIKYRLEKARRARKLLNDSISNKLTRKNTFAIELAQRKLDVEEAEIELATLSRDMVTKLGELMALKALNIDCSGIECEYNQLIREIPRQKTRIRNKERALQNWLLGGEKHAIKYSGNRLPRDYEPEKDIDALFDLLPVDPIRDQVLAFDIRNSPNFHEKPVTNITIDMITRRAEDVEEKQEQLPKKEVIMYCIPQNDAHTEECIKGTNRCDGTKPPTPEQIEERTLAEMHSAKYPIIMID